MANPQQDRIALEFPELRIQAVKQQLLELLTNQCFNDHNFNPQHQPDIAHWFPGSNYDVSRPHERRTWIWIAQKLQFIKTGMTTLLANFGKSGNLSNDTDDHARDLQFFEKFCNHQPLWFWVYMCWDHGRNVPLWNTSLLPEEQRLDIGDDTPSMHTSPSDSGKRSAVTTQPSSASKKKKAGAAAPATEDALTSLIQVPSLALQHHCTIHITHVTTSSGQSSFDDSTNCCCF